LADPPWKTLPSVHARALGAHVVYGLTTEGVRRLVRKALTPHPLSPSPPPTRPGREGLQTSFD
ncbi:MAG TPA: hypothetical protein VIJ26_05220, partial [Thermoanaerobaculia bacterium]